MKLLPIQHRLSRPSLSFQHPLPTPPAESADGKGEDAFILAPLLTLPPAFGSAYVGETFSCTLCANNEVLPGGRAVRTISGVRVDAEMKIPSSGTPLALDLGEGGAEEGEEGEVLKTGETLQRIVSFDLKEEGSHVLAVTVTYTEEIGAASVRVRTSRKLYQFVCKGCMVVRTKTGVLPGLLGEGKKWALEAQLENTGDETIMLDTVVLEGGKGIRSQGLNWSMIKEGEEVERPVLMPGDVQQVCFVVEEVIDEDGVGAEEVDGRVVFGILSLGWRGPMGNRGVLSTGTLGARV